MNRKELSTVVEDKLKSFNEGSYGILYPDQLIGKNSGHYFSWCVSGNKVHVIEGQPSSEGIVWDNNSFEEVGKAFNPMGEVHIANLANSPILPDRISDLMKTRNIVKKSWLYMKEGNKMISPNEAYNIFKKNAKEKIVTNVVADWGDIYTISNTTPGDFAY